MTEISSGKLLFGISVVIGGALWVVFALFDTEPWDSPYGWIAVAGLGIVLGFLGKGIPLLWPLGIFLGELLYGRGSVVKSLFFYSGGGANMFFPLGAMFLVPFTLPAFIGSLVGFGFKKALDRVLNPDARTPRAG